MKRRAFIAGFGSAAVAWPRCLLAQSRKSPVRIGFLPMGSPDNQYDQSLVEAFRRGLRQLGIVEGQDVQLDIVWTSSDPYETVTEVMRRGADLLIPCGSSASVAAKEHVSSIPIVFLSVGDPIAERPRQVARNALRFVISITSGSATSAYNITER